MHNIINRFVEEFFIVIITFDILLVIYFWNSYQFWKRKCVPYLRPSFPFGSMGEMMCGKLCLTENQSKIYHELRKIGKKYGGYYSFWKPTFMPLDPEIIKQVTVQDFHHFQSHGVFYNKKDDPLGYHLFSMEGEDWRTHRKILSPTMSTTKIKSMYHILQTCAHYLDEHLEEKVKNGEPLDIKDISARFSTDFITISAFGLDNNSLQESQNQFRKIGKLLFEERSYKDSFHFLFTQNFQTISRNIFRLGFFRDANITNFFRNTVRQTLEYRQTYNINRNDMLDILIKIKYNEKININNVSVSESKNLTIDEIIGQCFIIWAAGFETTSTLMTFTMYELAKHQDIQDRLRAEIKLILAAHNEQLAYEAIEQMTYLDQVMYEALRKYPPVGQMVRVCTKDWQIPGTNVNIPKGTDMVISIHGIHNDEIYYPDPGNFNPQRFTEEERAKRNPFTYMPFGAGPRFCIGRRLGLLQAKVGVITYLRKYKYKLHPKTVLPLVFNESGLFIADKNITYLQAERI